MKQTVAAYHAGWADGVRETLWQLLGDPRRTEGTSPPPGHVPDHVRDWALTVLARIDRFEEVSSGEHARD